MQRLLLVLLLLASLGCSRPSAMAICQRLEAGDVARACQIDTPEGLAAAASELVRFELKDTPGLQGRVFKFESEEHMMRTARSFESLESLGGKNTFISSKARILVHLSAKASQGDVDFTRDTVNSL